eukprot:3192506-Ditylum_brightwellii.AAC.2
MFKKQVKQTFKGQNIRSMDMAYMLVWDLMREDALSVFNNEQATFDELIANNFSRITKLNNYLTKFPMPPRAVPRKMNREEILEVLEIRVPMT